MDGSDPCVLQRIASLGELTAGERRLALFYEDNHPRTALLNLAEVAAATDLSSASVTRFARRLGYVDFRELHRALQAEARAGLERPHERRARLRREAWPARDRLQRRIDLAVADLEADAERVDRAAFERVAELISDTDRPLYLGAVASGRPLLEHFALLASYLRGDVQVLGGVDTWAHCLAGLDERAVVLAAAFDRLPAPVQSLLHAARRCGASTILLTNRSHSPLAREADQTLVVTTTPEATFRSRVGFLAVLEALLDEMGDRCPADPSRSEAIERYFEASGGYLPEP